MSPAELIPNKHPHMRTAAPTTLGGSQGTLPLSPEIDDPRSDLQRNMAWILDRENGFVPFEGSKELHFILGVLRKMEQKGAKNAPAEYLSVIMQHQNRSSSEPPQTETGIEADEEGNKSASSHGPVRAAMSLVASFAFYKDESIAGYSQLRDLLEQLQDAGSTDENLQQTKEYILRAIKTTSPESLTRPLTDIGRYLYIKQFAESSEKIDKLDPNKPEKPDYKAMALEFFNSSKTSPEDIVGLVETVANHQRLRARFWIWALQNVGERHTPAVADAAQVAVSGFRKLRSPNKTSTYL